MSTPDFTLLSAPRRRLPSRKQPANPTSNSTLPPAAPPAIAGTLDLPSSAGAPAPGPGIPRGTAGSGFAGAMGDAVEAPVLGGACGVPDAGAAAARLAAAPVLGAAPAGAGTAAAMAAAASLPNRSGQVPSELTFRFSLVAAAVSCKSPAGCCRLASSYAQTRMFSKLDNAPASGRQSMLFSAMGGTRSFTHVHRRATLNILPGVLLLAYSQQCNTSDAKHMHND